MNPQLANWMLARTPEHIKHPKDTEHRAIMTDQHFTLNTGAKIPAVGLGTWQSDPGQVKDAVAHALKVGYRHIDCAFVYGNENEVGEGLKQAFDSGLKREEVFITSKLWCTYHRKPEDCLDEGLRRLGLDYVDLYLMHWPVPMVSDIAEFFYADKCTDELLLVESKRRPSFATQTPRRLARSRHGVPALGDMEEHGEAPGDWQNEGHWLVQL